MIQLSSIAGHLQIKIVEKMGYSDQLQFVMSSKHGGDVLKLTKHKPVLEIQRLSIKDKDVIFRYGNALPFYQIEKNWSELSQLPCLPCFKVYKLCLQDDATDALEELNEKAVFVPGGVNLAWWPSKRNPDIFLRVLEMFDVKNLNSTYINGLSDLYLLPAFREIPSIDLNVGYKTPQDETLLSCKATKIFFRGVRKGCFATTANLFIKQWFEKKRDLEWFQLRYVEQGDIPGIREDLFSGVPFTVVWSIRQNDEVKRRRKELQIICRKTFRSDDFEEQEYSWLFDDAVYSIDRGDKKLVVFYCLRSRYLIAQEYTNLDDVIEIP